MLSSARTTLAGVVLILAASALGAPAVGQNVPLTSGQRDCQTIVQCNFKRGGEYRGCISAYRCRQCRVVKSQSCAGLSAQRPVCRRVVCTWG